MPPIAIIIFNRPDHAKALRESLQQEEERELFVISDGARKGRAEESERVEECRRFFADWPGKVHLNYASENMGCKSRVSSGLNWVFERTERAIILEDDCLPHPDFFKFCDELLEAYSDDERVMSICGTKGFPETFPNATYAFSTYSNCWGWATWKTAWEAYDDQFKTYPTIKMFFKLAKRLHSYRAALYWSYIARSVLSGKINSWAYCWSLTCFLKEGLHIYPDKNLIINNGFGDDSTHTSEQLNYAPNGYGNPLSFPLPKVNEVKPLSRLDNWIEDTIFSKSMRNRIKWVFAKMTRCNNRS